MNPTLLRDTSKRFKFLTEKPRGFSPRMYMKEFDELVKTMSRLRKECPWDREQSLETLRSYLIEEAYECLEAINLYSDESPQDLIEELGDVLLQIVFQSEILSERLQTKEVIRQVIDTLNQKLIRRHPHVFGNVEAKNADAVMQNWNRIKLKEKGDKAKATTPFEEIPKALPSLIRSFQIGKKSQSVRFDWSTALEVWKQVESEINELHSAQTLKEKEEEFGDLLFSLIQWARHSEIDPDVALARANDKFLRRFIKMMEYCDNDLSKFSSMNLDNKEELWRRAKAKESN